MVTGESLPVHKAARRRRSSAPRSTRNGTLRVRATKVGADTALAQIVKLVQEAQNSKAPGQRLADRAAFWLVFVALHRRRAHASRSGCCSATARSATAMLFAITVVVITCPDALGLATPTAIMVGTGLGAKRGVLFKNAIALETSARIDIVVMDKTGTLTKGEPEVTDVDRRRHRRDRAAARWSPRSSASPSIRWPRRSSRHADARERRRAAPPTSSRTCPATARIATVDGHRVAVGNRRLMEREGIDLGALGAAPRRARRRRAHRRARRRRRQGGRR